MNNAAINIFLCLIFFFSLNPSSLYPSVRCSKSPQSINDQAFAHSCFSLFFKLSVICSIFFSILHSILALGALVVRDFLFFALISMTYFSLIFLALLLFFSNPFNLLHSKRFYSHKLLHLFNSLLH